ncbi:MAG: hypothetical protein K0R54_2370 [Clostridiaceae bacterium]|jgi:hypothetical protein|nr:hypothetical protein [Clostridiaceae bacterium]
MILKPFLRPVFVKLIKPDESFVSDIINKILSTDNGDYGNLSLVYLKNASEDKGEESETLKADFDINFIYKLLMQLYAVKNNKNIINSSKSYHVQNIQNNLNHYLKALSYIDNNLSLKLSAINKEINEIYTDQIININEVISTLKKSSMINNNQMLNINRTVVFNGNYYNNEKNIAASNNAVNNYIFNLSEKTITSIKNNILSNNNLNRRSMSNFTNLNLSSKETEIKNNNNLFNKAVENYTGALNSYSLNLGGNIKFIRHSHIKNNILRQKLFNKVSNYRDINPIYGSINKISLHSRLLKNINKYDDNSGVNSKNLFHLGNSNYSYNFDLHRRSVISENGFVNNFSLSTESLKSIKEYNEVFNANYNNTLLFNKSNLNNNRSLFKFTENNLFSTTKASRINSDLSFNIINKILNEDQKSKKNFLFNKQTYTNNNSFEISSGSNSLNNSFILETNKINSSHLTKLAYSNLVEKVIEINNNSNLFNKDFGNYTDNLNRYYFNSSNYIQFLSYASIKNQSISKKIHKEINDYREVNYKGGNVNKFESFLFNNFIKNHVMSKELVNEINDYRKADYKGLKVNSFQALYFNTSRTNKILQHEFMRKNISPVMESLWSNIYKFNYSTTINNEKILNERNLVDSDNAVNNYISDLNRNVIILKSKFANNVSLGAEALKCIHKYNEGLKFYSKNSLFLSNSNSNRLLSLNSVQEEVNNYKNNLNTSSEINKVLQADVTTKEINLFRKVFEDNNYNPKYNNIFNNYSFYFGNNIKKILSNINSDSNRSKSSYDFSGNNVLDTNKASKINSNLSFNIINKILNEEKKSKKNFLFNNQTYSNNNSFEISNNNRTEILSGNKSLNTYFILEISKINSSHLNKLAYSNLVEKVIEINNNNNLFNEDFGNYTDNLNRYYFEVSNKIQALSYASIKNQSISKKIHKEINDYREVNYRGGKVNKFESFLFNNFIKNHILSRELFNEINDYRKVDYKGLKVNRFQDLYFNTSRTNKILQNELIRKNISPVMESLWSNIYKFNYSTTINNEKNLTERNIVDSNSAVSNSNRLLSLNSVKKEVNNYKNNLNNSSKINKVLQADVITKEINLFRQVFENNSYKSKYNNILNNYPFNFGNNIKEILSNSNFDLNSSRSSYDFSWNNVWNTNRASKINSNLSLSLVNKILKEEKKSKKNFHFNKQIYSNNNSFEISNNNITEILMGNNSLNNSFILETSKINSSHLNKLAYSNLVEKVIDINNNNILFNKEVENYTDNLNRYYFNSSNNIKFLSYTFTKNHSLSKKVFKEITKYRQASYNGGKVNKFESFLFNDFIKNHSLSKELLKEINDYTNRFLFLNSVQKEVNNYKNNFNNSFMINKVLQADVNKKEIDLFVEVFGGNSDNSHYNNILNNYSLYFGKNIKKYLNNANSNSSKSLYDFTGNNILKTNKTLKINSNLVSNIVNKILNEEQILNTNFLFDMQTILKTNKAEILNKNYPPNSYSLLKISKISSQGQEYKWYYSQLLEDGKQHNYISRNQIANNTNIIQDIILKSLILNKPIFKAVNNENTNNIIDRKSSFNDINKITNVSKAFLAYMKFSVIDKNTFDSDYFSFKNTKLSINKNLFNDLGAFHKLYNSEIFHSMTNNNHIKVNKLGSNANLYDMVVLKNQISRTVHFNNEKRLLNKIGALNQNLYEHKRNDFQADFNNDYVGYNRKKSYESNSEIFEETYKNKVNINHKRVQQANVLKEEKITDIKREQDREHIIEENMKRFINETVEILIEDKFKKQDREKINEDKQIENISNKVIEKIDRQLKYEKRRRGLI